MSDVRKPLSILVVGVSHELGERFAADFGLHISHAETYDDQADAIVALKEQTHFDLIITSYNGLVTDELKLLRQLRSLDHRKNTPVVMLSQQARD